jgi:hypothetical protein
MTNFADLIAIAFFLLINIAIRFFETSSVPNELLKFLPISAGNYEMSLL